MNKKGFGLIALIVIGVMALVVGFVFGSQSESAQLSSGKGDIGNTASIVNVYTCSADEVCEMNNLNSGVVSAEEYSVVGNESAGGLIGFGSDNLF